MKIRDGRPLRILDLDIEARPQSYWVPDRPTAMITAIAWCWVGKPKSMQVRLLGEVSMKEMLLDFCDAYAQADMVTGHYLSRYDLPQINGHLIENGLLPLDPILVQDTKTQYIKRGDQPATQEYLAEMLGIPAPKVQMSQVKWRKANTLSEEGRGLARERVTGDVRQHMLLRAEMVALGLLSPPRVWRP